MTYADRRINRLVLHFIAHVWVKSEFLFGCSKDDVLSIYLSTVSMVCTNADCGKKSFAHTSEFGSAKFESEP